MKILRLFLALLLLPTGPASGFDLFAKKKRSESDNLATDNGRPTRARELQQGMIDFPKNKSLVPESVLAGVQRGI